MLRPDCGLLLPSRQGTPKRQRLRVCYQRALTATWIDEGRDGRMTTSTGRFTEEMIEVAQTRLYMLQGGVGRPLLVLHGVEGHEGWLAFHDALAAAATVYAPSHPGYGHTERPLWMETIAHQAVFYQWFLRQAGLQG